MTDFNNNKDRESFGYECIDQDVGSNLWRLDADDTAPELRERLENHLSFCADCRMQRRVLDEVATGLGDGSLKLSSSASHTVLSRPIFASGLLALAASLILMFAMPPVSTLQTMAVRGSNDGQEILNPIPDEILYNRNPVITWQPLSDATSYNVRIEGVDNSYKLEQQTTGAQIQIPKDSELPVSERFRVFVEPVPAYLAPAGGWRSSFSTASLVPFIQYRLGAAQPVARVLWLFALGLLLMGALTPLLQKRRLNN